MNEEERSDDEMNSPILYVKYELSFKYYLVLIFTEWATKGSELVKIKEVICYEEKPIVWL